MRAYRFAVSLCGGWCDGYIETKAIDQDAAYDKIMNYIAKELEKTFPTLGINYNVECQYPDKIKEKYYYDVVASICNENCRTDSHLIVGGFKTDKEAMEFINSHNISEVDYYHYCNDKETAYIEIEERNSTDGSITNVITVD